jgi:hypothetical protein
MDSILKLTQETSHGVQDTVATISSLADLTKRLHEAIGRFRLGKEAAVQQPEPAASELPTLESFPSMAESVTTSDEEIKLGFIE